MVLHDVQGIVKKLRIWLRFDARLGDSCVLEGGLVMVVVGTML